LFEHIEDDIEFIFKTNNFKYIANTTKNPNGLIAKVSGIRAFNTALKMLSEELGIGLNLQSHSLRIGYITRTLNIRDVYNIYNTTMMVRHKSLSTTQRYIR